MHLILSALILLAAIIDMVLGIGFLLNPVSSGTNFGIEPSGTMGISAMRADMTAFFLVAALFMAWGAWKRRGDALLAPLALFGIAFIGRAINLVAVGAYDGWWMPMTVEAVHVLLMVLAIRAWGWRRA